MTTPAERAFSFFERGELRDWALAELRIGFRTLVDPETGNLFTEDAIARATQRGSFWYLKYDAIDIVAGMPAQSRAMWLADQLRPERAASSWLFGYHGEMWGTGDPLSPSAGSGPCLALALAGTIFVGSTTIPDPAATTARDPAGLRYQALTTAVADGGGEADVTLVGIDTGPDTNLAAGTLLTWENPPLGAQPTLTATVQFTGGLPRETAADYQSRLRARIQHKPGSGNNSQVRAWARDASTAVLDAYVYACAMHAGSTLVAITQKRPALTAGSTPLGPLALVASAGILSVVTGYLTPPASPVVPARVFLLVTTFTPVPTDVVLKLAQKRGSATGWRDASPWPGYLASPAEILSVTDQQHIFVTSDVGLPGGATSLIGLNVPHLMVWDDAISRFESLAVSAISQVSGTTYLVVLTAPPEKTLAVGDLISPDMARGAAVALGAEGYFDTLGPGEVVDLATDSRADRAVRFPDASEEAPSRAGVALVTAISDQLGSALSDAVIVTGAGSAPLPSAVTDGPTKLTLGKLAVYDLT